MYKSVQLVTGVCVAPLYHPLALARSLATVDRMSGGRIDLGVGVGWLASEFDAVGLAFHNRGRRIPKILVHLRAAQVDGERGGLPHAQDLTMKAAAWAMESPSRFGRAAKTLRVCAPTHASRSRGHRNAVAGNAVDVYP